MRYTFAGVLLLIALVAVLCVSAQAQGSLTGYYYYVPISHPDFQNGIDGGIVTGLVEDTLGPDGLPVASGYGLNYTGPSGPITDVGANDQILWWSAHVGSDGKVVVAEKVQNDPLPFNFTGFYPDGMGSNSNYFRTVHWTGTFNLVNASTLSVDLGTDDDGWLFIDGKLQADNGGVKGGVPSVFNTTSLAAGNHTMDLFFSDRCVTESGVIFNPKITVNPTVPEASSIMLAMSGLAALGGFRLRRRS